MFEVLYFSLIVKLNCTLEESTATLLVKLSEVQYLFSDCVIELHN